MICSKQTVHIHTCTPTGTHSLLIAHSFKIVVFYLEGTSGGSDGKASSYNTGDLGLIPGSGRSPGEGKGNPLQYCFLENPIDGGSW